jgi:hypothetical protein
MPKDDLTIPFPLSLFYSRDPNDGPVFTKIPPEEMPDPQRSLLCHTNDMTPTLEYYFGQTAHLTLLQKQTEKEFFFRHIILVDEDDNPMEVGAIKINMNHFPPVAQHLINKSQVPLGTIYQMFEIPHRNKPESFYKVTSDDRINKIFQLEETTTLYSRLNRQTNPQNEMLALALEILPPLNKKVR